MNNFIIIHIILVCIMLIALIGIFFLFRSYRKNSIAIYRKITKSDEISKDQMMTVEKTGSRTQEKFYNLEKKTLELVEIIDNAIERDTQYKKYLIEKHREENK